MNYELIKKLKEKGFPEPTHCDCSYSQLHGGYYAPSLSELIEACGEEFAMQTDKGKWMVQRFGEGKERITAWSGDPIEAVARLWLALNKK